MGARQDRELVLDKEEIACLRIWAWIKLVKSWALLRWSDIQAIKPEELRLEEGRLSTILRRTKTSEVSFFEDQAWIKTGFDLIKETAPLQEGLLGPEDEA